MLSTRRQVVKALLALGGGAVILHYWKQYALDDTEVIDSEWPSVTDPGAPSYQVFAKLSSLVTLRAQLDEPTTSDMFKVFMNEPWGPQHISELYRKLSTPIRFPDRTVSPLTEGESWFADHLLTTWYLGIYYHEERPTQRITYEHALMFECVDGIRPIPFLSGMTFGAWANKPESAHD